MPFANYQLLLLSNNRFSMRQSSEIPFAQLPECDGDIQGLAGGLS